MITHSYKSRRVAGFYHPVIRRLSTAFFITVQPPGSLEVWGAPHSPTPHSKRRCLYVLVPTPAHEEPSNFWLTGILSFVYRILKLLERDQANLSNPRRFWKNWIWFLPGIVNVDCKLSTITRFHKIVDIKSLISQTQLVLRYPAFKKRRIPGYALREILLYGLKSISTILEIRISSIVRFYAYVWFFRNPSNKRLIRKLWIVQDFSQKR